MTPERKIRISKLLALALRHNPDKLALKLDAEGWAAVNDVLTGCANCGFAITLAELKDVVATNDKRRFAFDASGLHIRANQGHSITVDLQLRECPPPDILYHGTAERYLEAIMKSGLNKMQRHHVHLSADIATARRVGQRHGKPVVLSIDAAAMSRDGFVFFLSENNVWLTDRVPPHYLARSDENTVGGVPLHRHGMSGTG